MVRDAYNVILVGAPGSGKGTQSVRLTESFGLPQISTGDILRQAVKDGAALGLEAKRYMEAGELVPDALIVDLIEERLAMDAYARGWVLDGFPRTMAQADALGAMLGGLGKRITHVIVLDVPEAVLVDRITGRRSCPVCGNVHHVVLSPPRVEGICDRCGAALVQRPDDREDKVRTRLDAYRAQTQEVIPFYARRGIVQHVDGLKTPDEVFQAIAGVLEGARKS